MNLELIFSWMRPIWHHRQIYRWTAYSARRIGWFSKGLIVNNKKRVLGPSFSTRHMKRHCSVEYCDKICERKEDKAMKQWVIAWKIYIRDLKIYVEFCPEKLGCQLRLYVEKLVIKACTLSLRYTHVRDSFHPWSTLGSIHIALYCRAWESQPYNIVPEADFVISDRSQYSYLSSTFPKICDQTLVFSDCSQIAKRKDQAS